MTPEQVKAKFLREGITFTDWATQNGFTRHAVNLVLNGQCKAKYGKGHAIAVKLGIKPSPAHA